MLEEFQTANLKLSKVGNKDEVWWKALVSLWYKVNSDVEQLGKESEKIERERGRSLGSKVR